jgi:hypothetical protein
MNSLLLLAGIIVLSAGCAPIQSSVSASAPHLPVSIMAKSSTAQSATNEPECPSSFGNPGRHFPRDSVEASWRWPELIWRVSCHAVWE